MVGRLAFKRCKAEAWSSLPGGAERMVVITSAVRTRAPMLGGSVGL